MAAPRPDFPHRFSDESLLQSAVDVDSDAHRRLEWLGDRVLGCAVARMLYEDHSDRGRGELTRALGQLVNNRRLADIGAGMGLAASGNGQDAGSQVANMVEALVGAVMLDGGMDAVQDCVRKIYAGVLDDDSQDIWGKDPKTVLKEHCEAAKADLPEYRHEGPDDEGNFTATCIALGETGTGAGPSKAAAEADAATAVVEKLGIDSQGQP